MSRGWVMGASLCALLFLGVGCSSQPVADVSVRVSDTPLQEGANFTIGVTVHNTSREDLRLSSVTITEGLYEGLLFTDVEPEESSWELDAANNYVLAYDQLVLEPDETTTVTLMMNAFFAGDYQGTINVCFQEEVDCVYQSMELSIQ